MTAFMNEFGIILYATLIYTPPLLYAALGSCFSEVSGVVNIGIEGMMTAGAFTGTVVAYFTGSPYLGFLCGGLAGMLFGAIHAFATVNLGADQTIAGTAINMLGPGIVIMIARVLFNSTDTIPLTPEQKIPTLFKGVFDTSTVFGRFMDNVFATYASTYLVFIMVILVWFVFYKTRFGLRLRSCGENPQAADSLGINVYKMRYAGTTISGALAGMGGFVYALTTANCASTGDVAGFGFLALAVMIFGNWKPLNIAGAALLFGLFKCIAASYSSIDINGDGVFMLAQIGISPHLYRTLPYLITLVVLAFTSKKSRAPKAEGIPYDKGMR